MIMMIHNKVGSCVQIEVYSAYTLSLFNFHLSKKYVCILYAGSAGKNIYKRSFKKCDDDGTMDT